MHLAYALCTMYRLCVTYVHSVRNGHLAFSLCIEPVDLQTSPKRIVNTEWESAKCSTITTLRCWLAGWFADRTDSARRDESTDTERSARRRFCPAADTAAHDSRNLGITNTPGSISQLDRFYPSGVIWLSWYTIRLIAMRLYISLCTHQICV